LHQTTFHRFAEGPIVIDNMHDPRTNSQLHRFNSERSAIRVKLRSAGGFGPLSSIVAQPYKLRLCTSCGIPGAVQSRAICASGARSETISAGLDEASALCVCNRERSLPTRAFVIEDWRPRHTAFDLDLNTDRPVRMAYRRGLDPLSLQRQHEHPRGGASPKQRSRCFRQPEVKVQRGGVACYAADVLFP
jgi:hypothetical protein